MSYGAEIDVLVDLFNSCDHSLVSVAAKHSHQNELTAAAAIAMLYMICVIALHFASG